MGSWLLTLFEFLLSVSHLSLLSTAQSQLPATGAPMNHSRHNQLQQYYRDYVRERTLRSWKFYLFSMLGDSLLNSYNANVSTASVDDLSRSAMAWLDQHCSLNQLRPGEYSLKQLQTVFLHLDLETWVNCFKKFLVSKIVSFLQRNLVCDLLVHTSVWKKCGVRIPKD